MNGRVPTPPKEPKPQARNHTRGATFPQASPRRGESPTSTLLPGFQKHFELALRPAWCTIFDIYLDITFFSGPKDFVGIFGQDEKCVFIKGDLVLFLTYTVKPIIIVLLFQNSITMSHLAVIQLMHVIKWPQSDSDRSCMNENVRGNKGFYGILKKIPGPKDFDGISGQDKKCLFIQYTIFEIYLNIKKRIYLFSRSEGFCWYIWS